MDNNIRIGILGNVDSGKSTLTGVLCNNELDDGKGFARSKILRMKHEKESGRTTNVTFNYLYFPELEKTCTLVDLAGHEKYLKTTLFGVMGTELHYGIIIVGANMGVTTMTKEHLMILLFLKIPIIVLITKIDIAPESIYDETKQTLLKILNIPLFKKRSIFYDNNVEDYINILNDKSFDHIIPIIPISSKTGYNIDKLKKLISVLPIRDNINVAENLTNHPIMVNAKIKSEINNSYVENNGSIVYVGGNFLVPGIGMVLSGYIAGGLNSSSIKKNQILYLGPLQTKTKSTNIRDKFIEIKVRSMHNIKRQEIDETYAGDNIVMAIKPTDNKFKLDRSMLYRGIVALTNLNDCELMKYDIKMQLKIFNNKIVIKKGYNPIVHCHTVSQCCKIIKVLTDDETANTNQNIPVVIRMTKFPIFVKPGNILYIRDGFTKGVGIVTSINPDIENTNNTTKSIEL
jgi:elongation factor 1-alpha